MNLNRVTLTLSALLLMAIGLIVGLLLRSGPEREPPPADRLATGPESGAEQAGASAALAQQLIRERQAREALEKRLETLGRRLAALEQGADDGTDGEQPPSNPAPELADGNTRINEQVLLEAGISSEQVGQVRRQLEALEMERLYLRDRATREGWIGSGRYVEALEQLGRKNDQVREQLGADNYGAYLYAIGEPNQVLVQSVIGGSPAEKAGLRAGDVLIAYGERRIYTWSDLREATTGGNPEEQVRLLVRREGQDVDTYINRGPMGIRLEVRSEPP